MSNVEKIFGSLVFNDAVMQQKLPKDTYKTLKKCIADGTALPAPTADIIAGAMKEWAVEHGATHFTHWFQPMTGITAEKHDSFINPQSDGTVILEFSGKELIKGEPDASSFPSGGLRATFEARGYTAWDPTSYAFIKDGTLCIPTAFCSYSGEALDKKTPLLRSTEALNKSAVRLLSLIPGNTAKRVQVTVGAEQEYFLIDRSVYYKRKDLLYAGRTLFGAMPPKGQELEDHYFGIIKPRVSAFMKELDEELWKLGIPAKTKHNEVAPAQHELAPVFGPINMATDHNQLTMEKMKTIAQKHDMACLLHEKPFEGINGSGKHNNWSLCTDEGDNLLKPGKKPAENIRFLLFLAAVIEAVDDYQDLLRISVASAGNDHRLGANEAPPAIVSMYLGDELTEVLEGIEKGTPCAEHATQAIETGVQVLPTFKKDTTDRNRTSPFAFTGNKFEFRMLGSAQSISGPNVVLNTIVAESLDRFADALEGAEDFNKAAYALVAQVMRDHKRIIFNGNNYSDEWVEEAERRGLLNLKTSADALPRFKDRKNIDLFVRHGVFSETEVVSRTDIMLEEYAKILHIEALCMERMVQQDILPAGMKFTNMVLDSLQKKAAVGLDTGMEQDIAQKATELCRCIAQKNTALSQAVDGADMQDAEALAVYYKDNVLPAMAQLRECVDALELICDKQMWPYPSTGKLIFSVK